MHREYNIEATFIGNDGSLGYCTNHIYRLKLVNFNNGRLLICRMDNKGICVYFNTITFLNNWSNVTKL